MNSGFTHEKQIIRNFYARLDSANLSELAVVLGEYTSKDYLWRGYHPFNEITSVRTLADSFWQPLRCAMTSMQRRMDVFMAGHNTVAEQGGVWVVSMGHLMGLFDKPWLGI